MGSRTITLLLTMLLVSSVAYTASAEIYRWEDANGINFTDDSSSVPEKFREKLFAEDEAQPESTTPPVNVGMYRQNKPDAYQESKAAVQLANLEQKRSVAEATKQKQLNTEDFQNILRSLAFYIEILITLGGILFVIWIVTIADIIRSKFIKPSNKAVWLLLVLLLPLVGMLSYMYLGSNYKGMKRLRNETWSCDKPGVSRLHLQTSVGSSEFSVPKSPATPGNSGDQLDCAA